MKFTSLLQYVIPHRNTLALIVLLLLAGSIISLANPWIAGQLTQAVLQPDSGLIPFKFILLGWLALLLLRGVFAFATQYLVGVTGQTMAAQLRSRVYEHLQALPLSYFQDRRPGDLLTLLATDAEIISGFVTNTLVQLLPQLLVFAGALVLMALLDPAITLLAMVFLPVYYVAMKLIGRRIRPITADWIKSWSSMIALVQENLGLIPAIKAFGREPVEQERFGRHNQTVLGHSRRQILLQSLMSPSISFLAGAGLLALLWLGLSHVDEGRIDAAGLVSLLLYAMLLTQPISALANVYGQVMLSRGAADRLLIFFAVNPEPVSHGQPQLKIDHGKIEYDHVGFGYPGRGPLLHDFNLVIEAGETVALTGPNGAGKSTLAHLLMRFIEPEQGRILIDGTDISQVDLASLRRQIGLVAQNTLLLNGTVADNIAYGQPLADEMAIKKAAIAARADEFIENLPDGYDTVIGDQGIKLSGGQRQRLSLARTLLKDPPILILDEATAMFDPAGESSFIEECQDLLRRKTVVLITHRPASLALAQRVLKMGPSEPLSAPAGKGNSD